MRLEALLPALMISAFVGMFALFIYLGFRQQRRSRENLVKLAGQLNLPEPVLPKGFFSGFKTIEVAGPYRGRTARVYNYTTGSGKQRVTWCAIAVVVRNRGGLTLTLSRESVLTKVGRVFGAEDIATGDPVFDDTFYLKSNDPDYVKAAFIPEVRAAVTEAFTSATRGSIVLNGTELRYSVPGSYSSTKICGRVPALLDMVCLLGDVVEAREAS